jgi:hypothetical protein
VNAGSVNQNDLAIGSIDHTLNAETGSLGFVRDGGDLLPDELIE